MRSPRTRRARCCARPNATPPPRRTRPSRSVPADLGQALPIDGAHPVHVSVLSGARAATVERGRSALTGSYEAAHVKHLRVDWPSHARARACGLTGPWDLGQWEATRPAPCRGQPPAPCRGQPTEASAPHSQRGDCPPAPVRCAFHNQADGIPDPTISRTTSARPEPGQRGCRAVPAAPGLQPAPLYHPRWHAQPGRLDREFPWLRPGPGTRFRCGLAT